MQKTIAAAVAALTIVALSFGPAVAATTVVVKHHPAHWGQHQVCKTHWHNHHKVKVCTWVKNHH